MCTLSSSPLHFAILSIRNARRTLSRPHARIPYCRRSTYLPQSSQFSTLRISFAAYTELPLVALEETGLASALLAAHSAHPTGTFLMLACDFPLAQEDAFENFFDERCSSYLLKLSVHQPRRFYSWTACTLSRCSLSGLVRLDALRLHMEMGISG